MTKKIYILGIISLLKITSLYGENPSMQVNLNTSHIYEQLGDYAKALELARKYDETSSLIEPLEKSLLNLGCSRLIFDENHQPRVKLIQLLEIVGMPSLENSENPIFQINDWAQKNLLRQGERWEEQTLKFEKLKSQIKPILSDLGFIESTTSHFTTYQGALVHGGLLSRVRLRLNYLTLEWNRGVRFQDLYFLGGERSLDAQQENKDLLIQDPASVLKIRKDWKAPKELPKTENEMIQLVWEQSEIPEDMRKQVTVHFINAPMKKDPKSNNLLRPTTDDTIEMWVKSSPPYGRYLAVTNAPYINRQDVVIRTVAPTEYGFDTIGPGAREQEKMVIILDELARLIFQTKQLAAKNGKN